MPTPVSDRTSSSAALYSLCSLLSTVPSQPQKKPTGMETIPGLSSGNQWKSVPRPNSAALFSAPVAGSAAHTCRVPPSSSDQTSR